MAEQARSLLQAAQNDLGHAVMQALGDQLGLGLAELTGNIKGNAALQALDFRQAAVAGDIAGLARPRRNGAETWQHQEQTTGRLLDGNTGTVPQKAREHLMFVDGQTAGAFGEVSEFSIKATDSRNLLAQLLKAVAEIGKATV